MLLIPNYGKKFSPSALLVLYICLASNQALISSSTAGSFCNHFQTTLHISRQHCVSGSWKTGGSQDRGMNYTGNSSEVGGRKGKQYSGWNWKLSCRHYLHHTIALNRTSCIWPSLSHIPFIIHSGKLYSSDEQQEELREHNEDER